MDDGFRGLLPFPFNSTLGGTTAAPTYFNNKNMASDAQYVMFLPFLQNVPFHCVLTVAMISFTQLPDTEQCSFFIELDLKRPYPSRSSDLSKWEVCILIAGLFIINPVVLY